MILNMPSLQINKIPTNFINEITSTSQNKFKLIVQIIVNIFKLKFSILYSIQYSDLKFKIWNYGYNYGEMVLKHQN